MPSQSPIEVAAALVFREGKLLIAQRFHKSHLGGLWEFPGGKREFGETWQHCLARELGEELGIQVEVRELIDEVTHAYPEKTVHLRFYKCRWLRNEPKAIGCPDFKWVSRDDLEEFQFPAADDQVVAKLKASETFWK